VRKATFLEAYFWDFLRPILHARFDMRLRIILIILSLLAFLSACTAGYLYYSSSKETAFREADRQAAQYVQTVGNHFSTILSENLKSAKALAGLPQLEHGLFRRDSKSLQKVNRILDHFKHALCADVCYLMTSEGLTVASSNRDEPDSFIGKNYGFRPYYQQAMQGNSAIYMALGITSKKRGVYYSYPVRSGGKGSPIGVAVIKASIDPLEKDFSPDHEGIVTLTDPHGVVFICNREDWLYRFLWKPSPEDIAEIASTRQFGQGPWNWTGLQMKDKEHAVSLSGEEYSVRSVNIDDYSGWKIVHLHSLRAIFRGVSAPLVGMTGYVILTICVFVGLLILFLYKQASYHIVKRKAAEQALRESKETALALLNAPTDGALLVDTQGRIIALNKPAADRFGMATTDLIGQHAYNLLVSEIPEQRQAHQEVVIRSRKPVRYEYERDGRCLDTSLYPILDAQGEVARVAIFVRDITEQKRTEQELRLAKEKLSRHSKDLERQVLERTREITSILKNTPAVIFIKNRECQYVMINPQFERLINVKNEEIRGKTDYDIFPSEIAHQFRTNDLKVIREMHSFQVEERVPHPDGMHTYLSVKFPLHDENGSVRAVCSIATDITEIKKAQDQLRRLSASIIDGQEKERSAVARELHDEFGQMLTALRMDAVWLLDYLDKIDPQAGQRALEMCDIIDKSIEEIRALAMRLRPGVLDHLGLVDALEAHTLDFERRTGIHCTLSCRNAPHLNDLLATAAYRIAQEALTNIARHACADQVNIALNVEDGLFTLAVADNGNGFDFQGNAGSESLGILGMKERASLVGGTFEIKSGRNRGTEVYFRADIRDQNGGNQ
jgi:PAS domain S-box-containing protein